MTLTRPRIGLLGGSFNPAHAGHLHLSLEALKTLALDEIWWLVSPANPLAARTAALTRGSADRVILAVLPPGAYTTQVIGAAMVAPG